jgi:hypothetical protein
MHRMTVGEPCRRRRSLQIAKTSPAVGRCCTRQYFEARQLNPRCCQCMPRSMQASPGREGSSGRTSCHVTHRRHTPAGHAQGPPHGSPHGCQRAGLLMRTRRRPQGPGAQLSSSYLRAAAATARGVNTGGWGTHRAAIEQAACHVCWAGQAGPRGRRDEVTVNSPLRRLQAAGSAAEPVQTIPDSGRAPARSHLTGCRAKGPTNKGGWGCGRGLTTEGKCAGCTARVDEKSGRQTGVR